MFIDIFAFGKISKKNTEFTEFKNRKRFFSLCHLGVPQVFR
jgi:hypothetical protein